MIGHLFYPDVRKSVLSRCYLVSGFSVFYIFYNVLNVKNINLDDRLAYFIFLQRVTIKEINASDNCFPFFSGIREKVRNFQILI